MHCFTGSLLLTQEEKYLSERTKQKKRKEKEREKWEEENVEKRDG